MGRNAVTFKSEAPLEYIVGTSNALTGHVVFDPNQPSEGVRGELTVPVASLRTETSDCATSICAAATGSTPRRSLTSGSSSTM